MDLALSLAAAAAGGFLLQWLGVPGGLIIGAMVGAALATLAGGFEPTMPSWLQAPAMIVVGAAIGVLVTRAALGALKAAAFPAVLSAVLIILAGLGIAYLLRRLGIAPPGDVLATSPGGITAVAAIAVEQRQGAVEVSLFHLVRVVLVLLSLPLLIHVLGRSGP